VNEGLPASFDPTLDTKDEKVVAFYEHLQFRRFASRPMTLFRNHPA
jgi:hypothetical protein